MVQELADRDAFLARGRELRPVRRDRLFVVDQTAIDEPVHRRRDDALRRGEAHGHRVGLPRSASAVASTGPGVDYELAAVVHGRRRAAPAFVGGDPPQRLGDAAEVGMDES